MTELVKYGSVGGVGRKPGPYPAANSRHGALFALLRLGVAAVADAER